MAVREDEVRNSDKKLQPESESVLDDWFWRPLKRHETAFLQPAGDGSAWRESGRRLQIANRLSSQTESRQSRLAYLYERKGERSHAFRNAENQEKGRTKW